MAIIFIVIAVELLSLTAIYFANLVAPSFSEKHSSHVIAWLAIHHVILFSLTVSLMIAVFRMPLSEWGFNFNKWKTSLVIIFAFAFSFSVAEFFYMNGRPYTPDPSFPLTTKNMLYWQGFQYLLSGLGEEPLFRGFAIVLLSHGLQSTKLAMNHQQVLIVILSTLIFMLAHLDIDWLSLSVSGFNFSQQTKALQLGILYAIVFIHTRSLFAPIVLHGLSNGITATIGFYFV